MAGTVKLDKLDFRILYELDCEATAPFAKIGKKLRVGRDVVAYRVKRLEETGVIEKYTSLIDFGKAGLIVAALYIKFHHDTPALRKEMAGYFSARDEVWWCFDMTPDYDFAFGWFGTSIPDVREKQFSLLSKYRKYIRNYKLRLFSHFYQFKRNYLVSQGAKRAEAPAVMDAVIDKVIDETDARILGILSEHARMPYVEIAKKLGLSPAQAHYRIKELRRKKVLLWARPKLDLEKIGFEYFKLDIYLDDYSEYWEIMKYAFSIPNVIYAFDVMGGADIEMDIHTKSYSEFIGIQDMIKEKFSQSISHTEYYQFKKEYKQAYFCQTDESKKKS